MALVNHVVIRDMDGRNPIAARLDKVQQILREQVVGIETNLHLRIGGDDTQQLVGITPETGTRQVLNTQLSTDPRRFLA